MDRIVSGLSESSIKVRLAAVRYEVSLSGHQKFKGVLTLEYLVGLDKSRKLLCPVSLETYEVYFKTKPCARSHVIQCLMLRMFAYKDYLVPHIMQVISYMSETAKIVCRGTF